MSEITCAGCESSHQVAVVGGGIAPAAIWFPPYGNPGVPAASAAQSGEGMTFAAALKAHEDRVLELIGTLSDSERAIAYKFLHASGLRIGSADHDLRKAIRREIGGQE